MPTYVTSPVGKVAHLGDAGGTRCRFIPRARFRVTDTIPPGYLPCPRCAARAAALTAAVDRARHRMRLAARDAAIAAALAEGVTDVAAARRLGMGKRTFSRYANDAMRRAGARSRFEWGYREGVASARRL